MAALLEAQAGVAPIEQLRRLGLRRSGVNAMVQQGEWRLVGPSVVVASPGPLTAEQREWAVVAAAGPGAALCGATAAAHHGLKGFDDGRIHVVVPRGTRPRRILLPVVIHESRRFDPAVDVDAARQLPMTRLERSVLDAAAWSTSARQACALAIAALQQTLTTAAALRDELGRLGRVQHHELVHTVLADVAGGPDALGALDLPRLCRQHSLPKPRNVVARTEGDGRRRFLEAELTSRRGKSWLVEIDAAAALIVGTYWSDCEPPHDLITTGDSVLYVPAVDFYLNELAVISQLHRLLTD